MLAYVLSEQPSNHMNFPQVETCAAMALAKVGATASDIVGVGITNQRETTVVWDRRYIHRFPRSPSEMQAVTVTVHT